MVLRDWRLFSGSDNKVFFELRWDDPQPDDDGIPTDPTADSLVYAVTYQNLDFKTWNLDVGGRTFSAPPGTALTTISFTKNQRFPIDLAGGIVFRPS